MKSFDTRFLILLAALFSALAALFSCDGGMNLTRIDLADIVPATLSFKDCPKLEQVIISDVTSPLTLEAYAGTCQYMSISHLPQSSELVVGEALACRTLSIFYGRMKTLSVLGAPVLERLESRGSPDADIQVRDCPALKAAYFHARYSGNDPEWTIASVAVSGCPALTVLSADDTEMVSASNCARLEELSMHTSHEYDFNAAPWHGGPLRSWSVTDCPLIRRISMDSRHVGGLLPDLLRN